MTAMLQVVFMAIGLAVLTFVIAFLFRKWQRAILWAVALLLFVGTSILLGAGVLKIFKDAIVQLRILKLLFAFSITMHINMPIVRQIIDLVRVN